MGPICLLRSIDRSSHIPIASKSTLFYTLPHMTSKEDQDKDHGADNLPAIQDQIQLTAEQPEVKHFPANTAETSIKEDNINYATFQLQVVSQCWEHATTFARVIKLLREQREVIKFRSDVMGLKYGFKGESNTIDELNPLD